MVCLSITSLLLCVPGKTNFFCLCFNTSTITSVHTKKHVTNIPQHIMMTSFNEKWNPFCVSLSFSLWIFLLCAPIWFSSALGFVWLNFSIAFESTKQLRKQINDKTVHTYPASISDYSFTLFTPTSYIYTPWKCQKTFGFRTFSGGIEIGHWREKG